MGLTPYLPTLGCGKEGKSFWDNSTMRVNECVCESPLHSDLISFRHTSHNELLKVPLCAFRACLCLALFAFLARWFFPPCPEPKSARHILQKRRLFADVTIEKGRWAEFWKLISSFWDLFYLFVFRSKLRGVEGRIVCASSLPPDTTTQIPHRNRDTHLICSMTGSLEINRINCKSKEQQEKGLKIERKSGVLADTWLKQGYSDLWLNKGLYSAVVVFFP